MERDALLFVKCSKMPKERERIVLHAPILASFALPLMCFEHRYKLWHNSGGKVESSPKSPRLSFRTGMPKSVLEKQHICLKQLKHSLRLRIQTLRTRDSTASVAPRSCVVLRQTCASLKNNNASSRYSAMPHPPKAAIVSYFSYLISVLMSRMWCISGDRLTQDCK
jgi:hypothetical protein